MEGHKMAFFNSLSLSFHLAYCNFSITTPLANLESQTTSTPWRCQAYLGHHLR